MDAVLAGHAGCPHYPPKVKGKALNEMVTNRQRAMVLSNANYLAALDARKKTIPAASTFAAASATDSATDSAGDNAAPTAALSPKAAKACVCRTNGCNEVFHGGAGWQKCGYPYCRWVYCSKPNCQQARLAHRTTCKQGQKAAATAAAAGVENG